jgi:predicted Rossmann fold nucleotide-binding protein DprA/Smf involved in DNA uptake
VDFALQQKKSVFVAPNSLFSRNGKGTNDLAAQGSAVLLSDFSQILGLFSSEKGRPRGGSKECVLTSEEREMLQLIALSSGEEVSNWISRFSGEYGEALSLLTQLEMKHVVGQQ